MKTSNLSNWLGLILCSLLLTWTPLEARGQSHEPDGLDMPAPRVRRRVPKQRSRITNLQVDRARQALMHSRPQPTRSYVPKHERLASAEVPLEAIPQSANVRERVVVDELRSMSSGVPQTPTYEATDEVFIEDGYEDGYADPYYDEGWEEEPWDGCTCGNCGGGCGDGGNCTGDFTDPSGYPFGYLWGMGNLEAFAGVQGFVGPYNQGDSGSFGFQEGFNFGTVFPILPYSGIGWQIGSRFAQSNLSGSDFTNSQRNQTFFTTGLFKRRYSGLQGGLVVDVLQDDWFAEANVNQLRGEISFKYPRIHEFGFRFATHTGDDEVVSPIVNGQFDTFEPINLYSLFYRRRLSWASGGITTIFAGGSTDDDGYIGAEAHLPFSDFLSLRSSFAYLIPDEPTNAGGTENEAWNVSIMLVFNLRGVRPGCQQAMFTPLFDVADNGNMIMDLLRTR